MRVGNFPAQRVPARRDYRAYSGALLIGLTVAGAALALGHSMPMLLTALMLASGIHLRRQWPAWQTEEILLAVLVGAHGMVMVGGWLIDPGSRTHLLTAGGWSLMLVALSALGVPSRSRYLLLGVLLWLTLVPTGISPALAGLAVALCVPVRGPAPQSPLPSM